MVDSCLIVVADGCGGRLDVAIDVGCDGGLFVVVAGACGGGGRLDVAVVCVADDCLGSLWIVAVALVVAKMDGRALVVDIVGGGGGGCC